MATARNHAGTRIGRLVITRRVGSTKCRNAVWECACDCGNKTTIDSGMIVGGGKRSCGCLRSEIISESRTTHGFSVKSEDHARALRAFYNARSRCTNPNNKRYSQYGGRGITVCPEWVNNPERFMHDMGPCLKGYSLERVDVNSGYSPENCRWIPMKDQAKNRTTNYAIETSGGLISLADECRMRGVNYGTEKSRIRRGKRQAKHMRDT